MSRAERRRLEKLSTQLHSKAGQVAITEVTNRALAVLHKEFGFGPVRQQRFLERMMGDE